MTDYDRGIIGRVIEAGPVRVTAEMICAFCAAVGEPNPVGINGGAPSLAAPSLTMSGRIAAPLSISGSFRAAEQILDYLPRNERRLLASMELEFLQPIFAGDEIAVASEVADIYEKTGRSGRLVFTVLETTLRNQNGETVTRIRHRFTNRSG
jgi:acyl dehydratase